MKVVALGGISAHSRIAGPEGWWNGIAGIRQALDPTVIDLIGIDWIEAGASGTRSKSDDGIITTADQADHLARTLDARGVERLDRLVGSSFGGNVALCFAAKYPERLSRLVVIGAAHRAHPMITALRSLQRRVVYLGLEAGLGTEALAIARGIAMTTYRTEVEFAGRFGTVPDVTGRFPVESYLEHQGAQYVRNNTPERFLGLSLALDLHEVDPARISTPTFLIAFEGDAIAPPWQMRELRDALAGPAELITLPSIYGHDAFLKETEALSPLLRAQLLETVR
jgi:homoserine O-acetyltransferase